MRQRGFALLWILLVPMFIVAQDVSPDASKVELKNLAPLSKDVLKVTLPKATEATLSNGLTVLIMENHRLPLVSIQYNIGGAGPLYEPANLVGLASVTAQMMRQGTESRDASKVAEDLAQLGASLTVASGFGSSATTLSASGLSDNFEQWFSLTNDVLLNPSFPADELDRLKQRLRISLRQQRTSAQFLASERFARAVFGEHPAGNVSATAVTLDALTRDDLLKWHADRFAPQTSILGITGDVKASELIPKLEKLLSSWKQTEMQEVLPANPKLVPTRGVYLVNRPNSVQTSLFLGNLAIDRRHPDYIPMVVANYVLGGGAAGRLFLNLREEKGYTYGAYSTFSALKYPGRWLVYADARTEVTDGAMTEFVHEIERMRNEAVPAAELEVAKRALSSSFALSLEDKDQLLNYAIIQKIYGYPADYWDAYPAKIMAVTAADVQRVAREYMKLDALQIVAVGDADKIRTILDKYGRVELYDAEGNKTSSN
jgi:zinc protease